MTTFVLRPDADSRRLTLLRASTYIAGLPLDQTFRLDVKPFKPRRSTEANAFLWGVVYETLLREGGEAMRGWTSEDLHEFFLGEFGGWEVVEVFGKKRQRPKVRSSSMDTTQFSAFVSFVKQRAFEAGVNIEEASE